MITAGQGPRPAGVDITQGHAPSRVGTSTSFRWVTSLLSDKRCDHRRVLAKEPSETARRVAAQRLTFQRVEVSYGDARADDRLADDVARGLDAGDSPLRAYLQGRTRFFDTIVVDAIEAGIGQILVGGAGYDGRAWRYSKPGVTWFEVDHPSTQRDKLLRLSSLGIDASHVRFIAADFAVDSVAAQVIQSGFAPTQPASFLLEGVAVYLTRAVLQSVLREFRDLAAPGSVLAISLSVSTRTPGASERRSRFQSAVEAIGEPARTTVEPHQVDPLLSATGWRQRAAPQSDSGGHARRVAAGFVTAEPA